MRARRVVLITAIPIFALGFAIYLFVLYGQLQSAFRDEEQSTPTRIYADVTRLVASQSRAYVEDRLRALAYSPTATDPQTLGFALHAIDYPTYLLPDGHAELDAAADGKTPAVTLHFDGNKPTALLQSIDLEGKEISDLYLEPELAATLGRAAANGKRELRSIVKFGDIPPPVWQAIISIEDQHFMEHRGLDPRGLARALWVDLKTHSLAQGGSTLTQQLVKNLMARRTKNVFRKINEIFLALLLEVKFSKEQILERYLNEVSLGQVGSLEVHGVAEGAEHFFGRRLDEINLAETALMAGLIRGTGYYSPYKYRARAIERSHLVLRKMVETGQIAEAEMQEALKMPIRLAPVQTVTNKAPYFTDFVKAELLRQLTRSSEPMTEEEVGDAGFRVYTTLDLPLSVIAQQSVTGGLANLEKKLKLDEGVRLEGALATVDQSTGAIRALVGGRSYAQSTFNRILNMKRQVGSTFKPIVYLAAALQGRDANGASYGPGHPAEDAPWTLTYDAGRQSWSPKNYEKGYMGWISYRTALAHSINTVAAKVGYEIGPENIIKTARALGIESDLPAVPSLALGVAELSPIELIRAYSAIANHGMQDDITVLRAITKNDGKRFIHNTYRPQQRVDAGAADLLTDMMTNVFTEGTAREARAYGFDREAAGKTGTTSNHRDSWFAGYTPHLTTVVWVGTDQGTIDPNAPDKDEEDGSGAKKKKKKHNPLVLTGATAALPIWADFMKRAHENEPPQGFPLSPNLVDVAIDRRSGRTAWPDCPPSQVVVEKFIKGVEPLGRTCDGDYPASVEKTEGK